MAILHRKTMGNVWQLHVDADPNGSDTAPKGSIAQDETSGTLWVNTDGSDTWAAAGSSGVVLDTDFDAQTALVAIVDDTPVAQVVAADEVIGRLTGGDIGAVAFKDVAMDGLAAADGDVELNDQDLVKVGEISQKDHAAFTGSETVRDTSALQTVDAAPAALWSLSLVDDTAYIIEALVVSRGTVATDENAYKIICKVYRRGGGAVLGGAKKIDIFTDESDKTWNVDWVVNANAIQLQVTGKAATVVNWAASITYVGVSGSA